MSVYYGKYEGDHPKLHKFFDDLRDYDLDGFEAIEVRHSQRPDLHAMIVLDRLVPTNKHRGIVRGADHDVIWLLSDSDLGKLEELITWDIALELVRCGVHFNENIDALEMFV